MGFFDKFSIPNMSNKKKTYELAMPKTSPIMGKGVSFETLATFDIEMSKPKYDGDIPKATIKFYNDFK